MTHPQYVELVLESLEEKGFGKLVDHYKPPMEAMSKFINGVAEQYNILGISTDECADMIILKFSETAESLFPSKEI